MSAVATPTIADLLIELGRLGVDAAIQKNRICLHPASHVPPGLLAGLCRSKAEMMTLLADPCRRWRQQAEALIAERWDEDCEDLLHLFDEREAIASVDGGLDDHHAGQLAYETLKNHLREEAE